MQQTTELIPYKAPDAGLPVVCQPHAFSNAYATGITPQGRTIAQILEALELPPVMHQYVRVWVDDFEISSEFWGHVRPKTGRTVYVRVMAHGGSGGKIIRTVLSIAIAVAAIYFAPVLAGTGVAGASMATMTLGAQIGTAIVATSLTLLGNMALNALIPPQQPTSPDFGSMAAPRYQLTGTQNRFEPYANIPRVFGRRRMYPLMAARPYSEVQGNDEYIRLALMVGWGPLKITDLRIGETPLAAFEGVEVETREGWSNDTALTLFTRTVTEQQFTVALPKPTAADASWTTRTTDTNTNEIILDITLPSGIAFFNDEGGRSEISVTFEVQYRQAGVGNYVSPTWLNASEAGFGTPGLITVTGNDTSAVRASGRFNPGGTAQWEVRVRKTTTERGDRYLEAAFWTVLRSVQPSNPIRQQGLALIAIRMKASGQLNGVPQSINCLVESYLPVYNGTSWSWAISRNPAWAYAHVLRSRGPETMIEDSRLDLPAIQAWATACAANASNATEARWNFDGVIEGGSVFGALRQIAAHARASFTIRDGKYSVVREVQQTVPVQHITPRNSSGYQGKKDFLDYPHALRVQFVNAAANFQEDEVIVYDDGYSAANASKFETLELPGCTSSTQAWREGRYILAAGRLRPEEHVISMDIESVRCTQGDLVRFAHDAISIGLASTRIRTMTLNPFSRIANIYLEEPVQFETGKAYGLRVRTSTGQSWVIALANPGAVLTDEVTVTSVVDYASSGIRDGDLVMFGESTLESAPMIVKRIENGPEFTARITLVDAQIGIYTADEGSIPPFNSFITVQAPIEQVRPATPSIANVRSNETVLLRLSDGTLQDRIAIDMNSPAASVSAVEAYETQWRAVGEKSFSLEVTPKESAIYLSPVIAGKQYEFRVRAVSRYGAASDFTALNTHVVIGKTTPPSTPVTMTATLENEQVVLQWASVPDPDLAEYEIRRGTTWETAVFVGRARSTTLRVALFATGSTTWLVKAVDSIGLYSVNAASASFTLTAALAPTPTTSFSGDQVVIRWNAPVSPLPIDFYEVRFGTTYAGGTSLGTVKGTTFSTKAVFSGSRRFWVAAVDVNGNVGTAGSVDAVVTPAPAPSIATQVVDNNVLLFWNDVEGSLPTATYEIRRGSTWAGGTVVGTKAGIFTTIFETVAGTYTYWIAAVDTAGGYGTPGSVSTAVNQPPDYVLKLDNFTSFSGTRVNMAQSGDTDGAWLMPVNATETFEQHFLTRSWATPQAQVDAGFPLFIQPSLASGSYEETIDAGAVLAGSKVTVTLNGATVAGSVTVVTRISLSVNGTTWTDYDDTSSVFGTSFRYVKYRVTVTGANTTALYRLVGINLRIDSKLISDAGNARLFVDQFGTYSQSGTTVTVTINAHGRSAGQWVDLDFLTGAGTDGIYLITGTTTNTFTVTSAMSASTSGNVNVDPTGTPIQFVTDFVDVVEISLTPNGTAPLIPVYNFLDIPNPTHFKGLLFTSAGARAGGDVSWGAKGY